MSERLWYRTTECADGEPGCIDSPLMTDAEVLRALLTTECETCGGSEEVTNPDNPEGSVATGDGLAPCPDCDGGRVLAEGVRRVTFKAGPAWESPEFVLIPAHMIEGDR